MKKRNSLFPGFYLSLGYTCFYLTLIVLIPLGTLVWKSATMDWQRLWEVATSARTLASFRLSFGAALVSASVNGIFGFLLAWILARYAFPGKKWVDALVDLPFALPTAVAGIALTAIYAPTGWLGRYFEPLGIQTAFSPLGVVLALSFVGLPFVVRTVQPVLQDLEAEVEEAATSLGAGRWDIFRRIILPAVLPSVITGVTLSFARGIGEYGSVVFISGNMPMKTEIAAFLIVTKLEQYDYAGAMAIALVMLLVSLGLFLVINAFQSAHYKKLGATA